MSDAVILWLGCRGYSPWVRGLESVDNKRFDRKTCAYSNSVTSNEVHTACICMKCDDRRSSILCEVAGMVG